MKLTEQQKNELAEYYGKNNNAKLKAMCSNLIRSKRVNDLQKRELIEEAAIVLVESLNSYDDEKGCKFSSYLFGNIKRAFYDWTRDNMRFKRCNLETDADGKIIRDEHNMPCIIPDVSIDKITDEGGDLKEVLPSNFSIDEEVEALNQDENVQIFINSLGKNERKIIELKMLNYSTDEVMKKLGITRKNYNSAMKKIRTNKNLSLFSKNKNDGNYNMEVDMAEDRVIEITESENYRTDKYSLYSLLQDKKNGDISCHYILQREPLQWISEEANRYFCRILSNLPIPEIVICEQKKKGLIISHLIDGLQRLSYAEAFKENRMKIGASGAERHLIQYRDYKLDENGSRILDEDGLPEYEMKVSDVVGKYYKDLPDELKKRFNNFNVNVTKFFDCTDEQIADHIRDYNNHASMNKEQGGFLNLSAKTAGYIKMISQKNTFFKNCGKFTDNNAIKGKLERVVAESIMLLFFRNSWKAKLDTIYKYIDENATEQQFLKLNSQFNRLELALGDANKELETLFTITTMPMWIAVFDKFTTYNMEDSKFVGFLKAYNTGLKDKKINGVSMNDFKDQQTKKKATITGKIDLLIKLMNEFLHIENEDDANDEIDESVLSFVQKNVESEITEEDVELYKSMAEDIVKIDSPIYINCKKAFIAIIAYACIKDQDKKIEPWLNKYQENNIACNSSQRAEFHSMKTDFDDFIIKSVVKEKRV